jgi:hypothetical protein
MCDYSLENQFSRPAEVGDRLVTSSFPLTPTRGFCAAGEPGVAVCLLPGTELVFERPVETAGFWGLLSKFIGARLGRKFEETRVARFRQVDLENPHTHHDALELADGRIVKLTMLQDGQMARVIQLPATTANTRHQHEHGLPASTPAARESVGAF